MLKLALVLPIMMTLLQPISLLLQGWTDPAGTVEAALTENATSVYFDGHADVYHFFSPMITLPFSQDELRYDTEGQAAVAEAKQRFMNTVLDRFGESMHPNNVFVNMQPENQTAQQFEGVRLQEIEDAGFGYWTVRVVW